MTDLEALFLYAVAFICISSLLWLLSVVFWPRKVENHPEPLSDAPGDWPNLGGM